MILIKSNQLNKIVVTLTQNTTLCDPEYLFQFVHIFSKQEVKFILPDVSPHPTRYNQFEFVEGQGVGQIPFPYEGEYNYYVYSQPQGSSNLNPLLATQLVENGIAEFIVVSADTTNENYFEFVSNNEFNSNYIFAPDEINPPVPPTPSITASPTPTRTLTPTPTPTLTPTPSSTPPPPFNPLSLGNLQHWYLSTSGATAASWTNLGLLGGSISQGDSLLQPTIITETLGSFTGTAVNYINGENQSSFFPTIDFSASSIFAVMKLNSYLTSQTWSINLLGDLSVLVIQTAPLTVIKNPSLVSGPNPAVKPELLVSASGDTSFFDANFNDTFISKVTLTGGTDSYGFNIGTDEGQTTTNNSVFEVLIYNRLLTSSEYAQVVSYLKTKYQYNTW